MKRELTGIIFGLIAICLWVIPLIVLWRIRKELKNGQVVTPVIIDKIVDKMKSQYPTMIIIIIAACIFSIASTIFLS